MPRYEDPAAESRLANDARADGAKNGHQQDIGSGQRGQARLNRDTKAGDDDREFSVSHQRKSGSKTGGRGKARRSSSQIACQSLGQRCGNGQQERDDEHRPQAFRINLKAEEEEENGSKEIA